MDVLTLSGILFLQSCLDYRLGIDTGIYDWWISGCPWHLAQSGKWDFTIVSVACWWLGLWSSISSPNYALYFVQALFFGGPNSLPWILARHELPWLDVVVDPCAAALVLLVTALLCVGIKEVGGFYSSETLSVFLFFEKYSSWYSLFDFCFGNRVHTYKELWRSWIAVWCYLLS